MREKAGHSVPHNKSERATDTFWFSCFGTNGWPGYMLAQPAGTENVSKARGRIISPRSTRRFNMELCVHLDFKGARFPFKRLQANGCDALLSVGRFIYMVYFRPQIPPRP